MRTCGFRGLHLRFRALCVCIIGALNTKIGFLWRDAEVRYGCWDRLRLQGLGRLRMV